MLKISLKAARVNAGYSQKEAAEKLAVTNKTLCNWEKGMTFPSADKVEEICRLYGIAYDNINFFTQ